VLLDVTVNDVKPSLRDNFIAFSREDFLLLTPTGAVEVPGSGIKVKIKVNLSLCFT
jgi:hypothetical protein